MATCSRRQHDPRRPLDAFNQYTWHDRGERRAAPRITREQQDRFAVASQNKAEAAQKAGRFRTRSLRSRFHSGRAIRRLRAGRVRAPRRHLANMSGLKPAFAKDGSVTAANASASMTAQRRAGDVEARAAALGLEPLARIRATRLPVSTRPTWDWPVPASRRCLERAGWTAGDSTARDQRGIRGTGLRGQPGDGWDPDRINVNGGASRSGTRSAPRVAAFS